MKKTILKQYFGYDTFRKGQEFLIDSVLSGFDVCGVMPTGAGKSLCFQVPSLIFSGITIVISPLISLMKDQVGALKQAGVSAAFMNSSLTAKQNAMAIDNARNGMYKIIYVAPERLLLSDFLSFAMSAEISMVTIDEAHCISQWGQDFRPSYLKIIEFIEMLPKKPVISAFTATATEQVRADIIARLNLKDPKILVTGFDRENLYFEVQKPKDKFTALMNFLEDKKDKCGIIYCSTRKTVEQVCYDLNENGYSATRYHAGLSDLERKDNQDDFIYDRKSLIVATNAFGMGIDKSNVSYVVHYNMPKNLESYYQEAGRAGRDGTAAECLLLYSAKDVALNNYFIDGYSTVDYEDAETERLLKQRDRKRLQEMTFYCHTQNCLREYILKYFGDVTPQYCGNCGNCNTNFEALNVTIEAQKILSCVKRAGERFGVKMIIDVLRGSKGERIGRFELDKLTTYGIMKDTTENRIRDIINYLVLNEYANITNDEYPVLKLTEKANKILFEKTNIEIKLPKETDFPLDEMELTSRGYVKDSSKKRKSKANSKVKAPNSELFERLKKVRIDIATDEKTPAFVIFSDATLIDMCMKLPKNEEQLLDVSGVGQVKLQKYGQLFINEIADFLSNNDESTFETITVRAINSEQDMLEFCSYFDSIKDDLELSDELVTISAVADFAKTAVASKFKLKLGGSMVTSWLVENGYLEDLQTELNGFQRTPTEKGSAIGIETLEKTSKIGTLYLQVHYNQTAQRFILNNITKILLKKGV